MGDKNGKTNKANKTKGIGKEASLGNDKKRQDRKKAKRKTSQQKPNFLVSLAVAARAKLSGNSGNSRERHPQVIAPFHERIIFRWMPPALQQQYWAKLEKRKRKQRQEKRKRKQRQQKRKRKQRQEKRSRCQQGNSPPPETNEQRGNGAEAEHETKAAPPAEEEAS